MTDKLIKIIANKIYEIRTDSGKNGDAEQDWYLAKKFIKELDDDRYTYDRLLDWFMEER